MFCQNAVGYLDKNCRREIEENEWLKEEVRGSLACSLSWQFMFEILWPMVRTVSSHGPGRLLLVKESSFPVINL